MSTSVTRVRPVLKLTRIATFIVASPIHVASRKRLIDERRDFSLIEVHENEYSVSWEDFAEDNLGG